MSTSGLSGSWMYRSFNPTYVMGDQTPQEEVDLILAGRRDDVYLNLVSYVQREVVGTIEWPGGGLNLKGTVDPDSFSGVSYDFVGTGRPDTDTAGWEYGYHGHTTGDWLRPREANSVDPNQRSFLVGSVIRAKPHNGQPGDWLSEAGAVYSFIALWQPSSTYIGRSYAYRSFHYRPRYVYPTAPQTAHLILQEAVFRLETGTSTTEPTVSVVNEVSVPIIYPRGPRTFMPLQGTIEWPGGSLDIDSSRSRFLPDDGQFSIRGTGRPDTATAGWEYHYAGHLTRQWPNGINQVPALVGSVMRAKSHGEAAPAGYVAPFIAVKQP
jgi:hypothetical protein